MITDVQLAVFSNILGMILFLMIVLFHYVTVNAEGTDFKPTQMQIAEREQEFHNMVREYVVFLLIFISLYGISYILIYIFRKKREEVYANEEDALVYRISFWMCTFALAVSIGSAFLLPFSIITNELLLYYPQNYYMQWLNDCFSGSSRGIMSRVNETIVLILLLMVIILGITYLLCCIFGYSELALTNLLTIWHYLPLLYSCISFFGVILLLICTPIGFAILFTVLGDLIVKPQFLRDIEVEYEVALLEEMNLRAKFERKKSENVATDDCNCPTHCNQKSIYKLPDSEKNKSILEYCKSKSLPSFTSFLNEFSSNRFAFNNSFDINNSSTDNLPKSNNLSEIKDQLLNETVNNCSIAHLNCIRKRNQMNENNLKTDLKPEDNFIDKTDLTDENKNNSKLEDILKELNSAEIKRKNLQILKRASSLRRNIGYPLAIILLLCLTLLSIGMVLKNILELLIGIKALPISSATHRFSLGIASLYKLGYFGAVLEIFLILYLWNTSLVGLYSLQLLKRIKPQKNNTSFTKIIINCSLLLVLSSALPVLARTIGITNFDLLGDFGKINWLGNFYVVLFYNILFVSFSTFTLAKKFTILIHNELFKRLINLWILHLNSLSRSATSNKLATSSVIIKNSTKQNGNLNSSLNTE